MRVLELRKVLKCNEVVRPIILQEKDLKNFSSSFKSGEWCLLSGVSESNMGIGFVSCRSNNKNYFNLIHSEANVFCSSSMHIFQDVIAEKITRAVCKRRRFSGFDVGCRLIYGFTDGLPGVIVDEYENCILIQILNLGFDVFRQEIKGHIEHLTSKRSYLVRVRTGAQDDDLPTYTDAEPSEDIIIHENGFKYVLPYPMIQKNGYYYDHRNNRAKLECSIADWKGEKRKGLDLFSYCGAWGMHLLRANVQHVTFVDQGNFASVIENNIVNNRIHNNWCYHRQDVFDFLKKHDAKEKFDIIVCDPPAFSKSSDRKFKALLGYEKLYRGIFKLLADQAFLAVASCTYGVSHQDLAKLVRQISHEYSYDVTMMDLGIQGADHCCKDFDDKAFYIKYLLFYLDRR